MTHFLDFGFQQGLPANGPGAITSCWSGENNDGSPNPAVQGKAGAVTDGGTNFVMIPAGERLIKFHGDVSVKVAGVELLFRLVCGRGDFFVPLLQRIIETPLVSQLTVTQKLKFKLGNLPDHPCLRGDEANAIWAEWQAIDAEGATGFGRAFEMQCNVITIPF